MFLPHPDRHLYHALVKILPSPRFVAGWTLALLFLGLTTGTGCGIRKRVKKLLNPTASILGVHVVEETPEYTVVRVDMQTDDVNLLLGFVKMRFQVSLEDTPVGGSENVQKDDLAQLESSGLSFLYTIKHEKGKPPNTKQAIRVSGAIVIKLIAELATIPFEFQGVISAPNPK